MSFSGARLLFTDSSVIMRNTSTQASGTSPQHTPTQHPAPLHNAQLTYQFFRLRDQLRGQDSGARHPIIQHILQVSFPKLMLKLPHL